MGWNKDGSTVKAVYCDRLVTGVVTDSRVKYGGTVQYTLQLEEPLVLPWGSVNDEPRTVVLIDENSVIADFGVIENAN